HHRRLYQPTALVLRVDGGGTAPRNLEHLGELWGGGRAGGPIPAIAPPRAGPASSVQRRVVGIAGKSQADIVLGVPGFSRMSEDFYAGMLADLILGRLGLMGRLGATLRDKEGLAYYVYSQAQAGFLAGPWAVRAGVNPKN